MSIDLDRITHPLRLAAGSHQEGSGKGCAMNVISYINGDTMITDYPDCSARPLARMVQQCNDILAGPDGFLSPGNSVLVLDLGWQTVGTANVPDEVKWRWLHDILVDPTHGVVKHARPDGAEKIRRVAELCARQANGDHVSEKDWRAADADADAYAAADAFVAADADADAFVAAADAFVAAAAAADAFVAAAAADAFVAAAAADAFVADAAADAFVADAAADAFVADAAAGAFVAGGAARIEFTRWAIQRWRDLAGLDATDLTVAQVNSALDRIYA